jgi:ribosome-binding protein aMBF1 (putative translation factor)
VDIQGNMTADLAADRAKQIRDARALLGWSRDRLASMAELRLTDVIHLERAIKGVLTAV